MTIKQFFHLDFMAAAGLVLYAALVTLVPALQPLAEVFATPQAAVTMAGAALIRFAAGIRTKGGTDVSK